MGLSSSEKEALSDYYRNHDLYDPSKAPEQKPHDFSPCMCGGGCAPGMCGGGVAGYDDGGVVGDPLGIQTDPNAVSQPFQMAPDDSQAQADAATAANGDPGSQAAFDQALTVPDTSTAPQDGDSGPDEPQQGMDYSQLLQGLRRGPSGMESAASGLAGLGDAIVQGVGRAGNPGFQKNLQESRQNMQQNLINALREKYEAGYKGKGLALEQQKANDENTRAAAALKEQHDRDLATINETKEARRLTATGQAIESQKAGLAAQNQNTERKIQAANLPATGLLHPSTWGQKGKDIESLRSAILGDNQSGPPIQIKTHVDYLKLPAGTHYIDEKGKEGVKK